MTVHPNPMISHLSSPQYQQNKPRFEHAYVLSSEYCEGRLEHEELVFLSNGLQLELKWGGPFRKEGPLRPEEKVEILFHTDERLTLIRYQSDGHNELCRENFIKHRNWWFSNHSAIQISFL